MWILAAGPYRGGGANPAIRAAHLNILNATAVARPRRALRRLAEGGRPVYRTLSEVPAVSATPA